MEWRGILGSSQSQSRTAHILCEDREDAAIVGPALRVLSRHDVSSWPEEEQRYAANYLDKYSTYTQHVLNICFYSQPSNAVTRWRGINDNDVYEGDFVLSSHQHPHCISFQDPLPTIIDQEEYDGYLLKSSSVGWGTSLPAGWSFTCQTRSTPIVIPITSILLQGEFLNVVSDYIGHEGFALKAAAQTGNKSSSSSPMGKHQISPKEAIKLAVQFEDSANKRSAVYGSSLNNLLTMALSNHKRRKENETVARHYQIQRGIMGSAAVGYDYVTSPAPFPFTIMTLLTCACSVATALEYCHSRAMSNPLRGHPHCGVTLDNVFVTYAGKDAHYGGKYSVQRLLDTKRQPTTSVDMDENYSNDVCDDEEEMIVIGGYLKKNHSIKKDTCRKPISKSVISKKSVVTSAAALFPSPPPAYTLLGPPVPFKAYIEKFYNSTVSCDDSDTKNVALFPPEIYANEDLLIGLLHDDGSSMYHDIGENVIVNEYNDYNISYEEFEDLDHRNGAHFLPFIERARRRFNAAQQGSTTADGSLFIVDDYQYYQQGEVKPQVLRDHRPIDFRAIDVWHLGAMMMAMNKCINDMELEGVPNNLADIKKQAKVFVDTCPRINCKKSAAVYSAVPPAAFSPTPQMLTAIQRLRKEVNELIFTMTCPIPSDRPTITGVTATIRNLISGYRRATCAPPAVCAEGGILRDTVYLCETTLLWEYAHGQHWWPCSAQHQTKRVKNSSINGVRKSDNSPLSTPRRTSHSRFRSDGRNTNPKGSRGKVPREITMDYADNSSNSKLLSSNSPRYRHYIATTTNISSDNDNILNSQSEASPFGEGSPLSADPCSSPVASYANDETSIGQYGGRSLRAKSEYPRGMGEEGLDNYDDDNDEDNRNKFNGYSVGTTSGDRDVTIDDDIFEKYTPRSDIRQVSPIKSFKSQEEYVKPDNNKGANNNALYDNNNSEDINRVNVGFEDDDDDDWALSKTRTDESGDRDAYITPFNVSGSHVANGNDGGSRELPIYDTPTGYCFINQEIKNNFHVASDMPLNEQIDTSCVISDVNEFQRPLNHAVKDTYTSSHDINSQHTKTCNDTSDNNKSILSIVKGSGMNTICLDQDTSRLSDLTSNEAVPTVIKVNNGIERGHRATSSYPCDRDNAVQQHDHTPELYHTLPGKDRETDDKSVTYNNNKNNEIRSGSAYRDHMPLYNGKNQTTIVETVSPDAIRPSLSSTRTSSSQKKNSNIHLVSVDTPSSIMGKQRGMKERPRINTPIRSATAVNNEATPKATRAQYDSNTTQRKKIISTPKLHGNYDDKSSSERKPRPRHHLYSPTLASLAKQGISTPLKSQRAEPQCAASHRNPGASPTPQVRKPSLDTGDSCKRISQRTNSSIQSYLNRVRPITGNRVVTGNSVRKSGERTDNKLSKSPILSPTCKNNSPSIHETPQQHNSKIRKCVKRWTKDDLLRVKCQLSAPDGSVEVGSSGVLIYSKPSKTERVQSSYSLRSQTSPSGHVDKMEFSYESIPTEYPKGEESRGNSNFSDKMEDISSNERGIQEDHKSAGDQRATDDMYIHSERDGFCKSDLHSGIVCEAKYDPDSKKMSLEVIDYEGYDSSTVAVTESTKTSISRLESSAMLKDRTSLCGLGSFNSMVASLTNDNSPSQERHSQSQRESHFNGSRSASYQMKNGSNEPLEPERGTTVPIGVAKTNYAQEEYNPLTKQPISHFVPVYLQEAPGEDQYSTREASIVNENTPLRGTQSVREWDHHTVDRYIDPSVEGCSGLDSSSQKTLTQYDKNSFEQLNMERHTVQGHHNHFFSTQRYDRDIGCPALVALNNNISSMSSPFSDGRQNRITSDSHRETPVTHLQHESSSTSCVEPNVPSVVHFENSYPYQHETKQSTNLPIFRDYLSTSSLLPVDHRVSREDAFRTPMYVTKGPGKSNGHIPPQPIDLCDTDENRTAGGDKRALIAVIDRNIVNLQKTIRRLLQGHFRKVTCLNFLRSKHYSRATSNLKRPNPYNVQSSENEERSPETTPDVTMLSVCNTTVEMVLSDIWDLVNHLASPPVLERVDPSHTAEGSRKLRELLMEATRSAIRATPKGKDVSSFLTHESSNGVNQDSTCHLFSNNSIDCGNGFIGRQGDEESIMGIDEGVEEAQQLLDQIAPIIHQLVGLINVIDEGNDWVHVN